MEGLNISKRTLSIILIVILALVVWKITKYSGLSPDGNLYQVVLLQNDQVFYGKLHKVHSDYPYLTDVYYLNPQEPELDRRGRQIGGNKFTVVKRGFDEIHQPSDKLYFSKENILYWENVGSDSLVGRGIKADKDWRAQQAAEAAKNAQK